jgi:hypothetical protein
MLELIATVIAVLTAPVIALFVGYYLQQWQQARERKMFIFRTLIGERATFLSRWSLAAMNLIVLEFRNCREVVSSWEKFFDYVADEGHDFTKPEVQQQANTLRAAMLLEMTKVLKMDRHIKLPDLSRGYYPDFVSKPDLAQRELLIRCFDAMQKTGGIPLSLVYPPIPGAELPGAAGGPSLQK